MAKSPFSTRVMRPLQAWLDDNGMARSSYYYYKSNFPDMVPEVVTIGKSRKYVTEQADAEYRARINSKLSNTGAAA